MDLTVRQEDFLRASTRTHSIVETKRVIEIEQCVLLEAADGMLEFRTSSPKRVVIESIPALVSEPGTAVVGSAVLNQIVRQLPKNSDVRLNSRLDDADAGAEGDGGAPPEEDTEGPDAGVPELPGPDLSRERRLRLTAGHAEYALALLDPMAFPAGPDDEYGGSFGISGADLKLLLEKTYRAVPTSDDARYYLQGVYLHPSLESGERRLTTVASDSHRLARMSLPAPEGSDEFPGVIVPAEAVATLRACIEDDDSLRVATADNKLRVAGDQFSIITRVIDAKFPDYNRVIPREHEHRIEFERRALATCIARVAAVTNTESERVHFRVADGMATLSVRSRTGNSEDQIAAIYSGPELEFILLDRHLLDVIAQIEGESLVMFMRDGRSAFLVTEQCGDGSMTCVIMPHRA